MNVAGRPTRAVLEFKDRREQLRNDNKNGIRGLVASHALTGAVDQLIGQIWSETALRSGAGVVAVGGYGRSELCPGSDIDIVLIHHKSADPGPVAKRLSYEMWDAGLELAPTVATIKESIRLARQEFDSETAFLDARLVAGDSALFEEWSERVLAQSGRSGPKFVAKLRDATSDQRVRFGDAGAELEPDLKAGKGGLREIAAIGWISKVPGLQPVSVPQRSLEAARDFLLTVRQALHWRTGRRNDVLLMQLQADVAGELDLDEFTLMRRIYELCRPVAFALDSSIHDPDPLQAEVETFVGSFDGAATVSWSEAARSAFMRILSAGRSGRDAFWALDQRGALTKALPAWQLIRCLPQRNVYHRYAVDVHSLEAVCAIASLRNSPDELVRQVALDSKSDSVTLLLSALFHDIGKGSGQDHSRAGEELAVQCLQRMGVSGEPASDVPWLVRNHLLLSETATRRDIGDESLIVELAEKIASPKRLALLFMLSVADAMATGPQAWTTWKADLVSQLFAEVNHLLEQGELVGGDLSAQAAEKTQKIRASLSDLDSESVQHHLSLMPRAWLLSQPVEDLIRQSRVMLAASNEDLKLEARPRNQTGLWEVNVVANDRPGLFSKIAGSLAVHGLNVVAAQVFTREDSLALEIFLVEATTDEPSRFDRVKQDAALAIENDLDLETKLAVKRSDYASKIPKGKQEPPQVVVDNRASDFYTVVEVHASDRIGLLYTITSALSELGLDIHLGKVATYAEDVVDSFYVRDAGGQKVTDPDEIEKIKRVVLERLEYVSGARGVNPSLTLRIRERNNKSVTYESDFGELA